VEVDLIIEARAETYACEIRFANTINRQRASGLMSFPRKGEFVAARVTSLQDASLPITEKIAGFHWKSDKDDLNEPEVFTK
jgi:hypothetical protein